MKTVYLVGIGMGDLEGLTREAEQIIKESDVIIGANRMIEPFQNEEAMKRQTFFSSYRPKEIGEFLRGQMACHQAAVLLSGDVGFYSGAKGLLEELTDFQVKLVPGISSMIYFCSKLKISWDDVCFTSAHGKDTNLIQRIKRNRKTFALLDGGERLEVLCKKLMYYGMGEVDIHIGQKLSYDEEVILTKKANEIDDFSFGNLLVVLVENNEAVNEVSISIPDEEFIRDKVPMTKQEIRNVSIGKLQLQADSVVYDIGAGSGSISIETAMQSPDIKVYAIEKKEEAVSLIQKNKQKFAADNVEIISGLAPDVLEGLPSPTHVFIGGSSGNIEEIIHVVLEKNPDVRIVINTVALNSLAQVMNLIEKHLEWDVDVIQMQVSKDKVIGGYHMMMGQNPIYIISIEQKKSYR